MPIDLGLKRIGQLLNVLGNPQRAYNSVHIAGTNGKGSICSYISSVLGTSNIKNGKFTSPHLIQRSDCITINDKPIAPEQFLKEESKILSLNDKFGLNCTEFEILTCTAFQIFKLQNVDVAVVEVGLGGRLDATNVLEPPKVLATGISKIGLDHEGILGSTLKEIAFEKAGIMKHGVPCVVDGTNKPECFEAFHSKANEMSSPLFTATAAISTKFGSCKDMKTPLLGEYQHANLAVALKLCEILSSTYPEITTGTVKTGISSVQWPGRLQTLKGLQYDSGERPIDVMIDGAHNGSAAIELSKYIAKSKRGSDGNKGVTFVMAVTEGKSLKPLLSPLITPKDSVIVTTFGPVDGMPWIKCNDPATLANEVEKYGAKSFIEANLKDALKKAASLNTEIVICGSLYLVGEVLRMVK